MVITDRKKSRTPKCQICHVRTFKRADKKGRNELLDSIRPLLRRVRDSIHTEICKNANEN